MEPQNIPRPRARRYALHVLAWVGVGLAAVTIFGVTTDPYAFSWPHPHLDPAFRENDLEVRMNIAAQIQPDVLLLGNSRVQHGLDPHNPVFGHDQVFNAAIVDAKPGDLAPIISRAQRNRPLKMIVMTIDFNMLYGGAEHRIPNANLLRQDGALALLARIRAILSVDALRASALEVSRYFRHSDHVFDPDGRILEPLYEHDIAVRGGTLAAVRQRDAEAMFHMTEAPSLSFLPGLKGIIESACANHTRLVLYISPLHAHQLESIVQAGKWNDFTEWKRQVMQLASAQHQCDIELWDFARFNKITEEPVPRNGPMKYYWESSHYRRKVGDAILLATVGRQTDPGVWQARFGPDFDADFGQKLTPDDFTELMQREDQARVAWERANPEVVADVAAQKRTATSAQE